MENFRDKLEKRFLNYVSYWTTSDEEGTTNPTSPREFDLARVLEQELKDMGLEKVLLSDTCYVYGLLPATPGMENKKAIGLTNDLNLQQMYYISLELIFQVKIL